MKALDLILKAKDLEELKSIGPYKYVRSTLEESIQANLKVNGWQSLYSKIQALELLVSSNKEVLKNTYNSGTFHQTRKLISEILQLQMKSKNRDELNKSIDILINNFSKIRFDPYKRFEETKIRNFKSSSRLEGINIETQNDSTSLESVLSKYRKRE